MRPDLRTAFLFAAFLFGGTSILKALLEGLYLQNVIWVILLVSPLLLALLLRLRPVWTGILIGASMYSVSLPVLLLDRLDLYMLTTMAIMAVFLVGLLIVGKGGSVRLDAADRLVLLAGLIILIRFVYDRPGSARVGAAGGLGWALPNVLACPVYMTLVWMTHVPPDLHRNLRVAYLLTLGSLAFRCVLAFRTLGLGHMVLSLFEPPLWLLSGTFLSTILQRARSPASRSGLFVVAAGAVLALAACSAFRSRLYFALLIIGVVALVHGRIRSMLAVLLLMGGLGIAFLQVMGPRHIPLIMKRSLSTVVAMDTDATKAWSESYRTSGEQGWESGFRATLYELAWSRIRVHPLVGNGFRFTNEELAASLVAQGQDRMVVGLALSGGFHNSFVSLAVACGLPAMFLLVAGLGLGLLRMFRDVSRIGTPANRTWVAVLLGYTLSWVGQALMNGAGRDLMIVCMLVPIVRSGVRASLPESVARVPEAGHDRVGIATEGSPV